MGFFRGCKPQKRYLCPGTGVTHVSGLNSAAEENRRFRQSYPAAGTDSRQCIERPLSTQKRPISTHAATISKYLSNDASTASRPPPMMFSPQVKPYTSSN